MEIIQAITANQARIKGHPVPDGKLPEGGLLLEDCQRHHGPGEKEYVDQQQQHSWTAHTHTDIVNIG